MRAHINKFEDLAAAAAAAKNGNTSQGVTDKEDDVPPQDEAGGTDAFVFGSKQNVSPQDAEENAETKSAPPQVDTNQGGGEQEAEENVETKSFFENFSFQPQEELASRQSIVLQSLSESLRLAFAADDKNMLMEALNAMTPEEQNYHEQRMIECRLLYNPGIKPPLSPAKGMSPRSDVKTEDMEKLLVSSSARARRIQARNSKKRKDAAVDKKRNKHTPDAVKEKINWVEELREKVEEKSGKRVTFDETVTQTEVEILD